MRHQRRLLSALAAAALLATAGCGGDDADSADSADVPADAVARVDDTVIKRSDARTFLPPGAGKTPARQVYQSMILADWLRRDAKREGVDVPAGTTGALLVPVLLQSLTQAEQRAVSERDVARYYREHPREYARPETRFMRSVATDSRADALAAREALERGESWKAVIERYGTRAEANPQSGDMGAQPGEMPDPLGDALYAAERGTVEGPVQTDMAWYVFELKVIDRGAPQSLAQVREALRSRLEARRQTDAIQTVRRRLEARYRPLTVCAERLLLPPCRNASEADRRSMWTLG